LVHLSGTIIPWLLGALVVLATLAVTITIKSWREAKRSPYFFLRRQAQQRMQTYSVASFGLIVATLATAAFTLRPPQTETLLSAAIHSAKPVEVEEAAPEETEVALVVEAGPQTVRIGIPQGGSQEEAAPAGAPDAPILPAAYDQFEPTAELNDNTKLGTMFFSTEIDDNYEAVEPGRRFPSGFYTLYATFTYEGMANGMEWAWVWRHNGEVVDGGNELWNYGDDGPGYVYYNPEAGFEIGSYSLEVWVNGEMLTQGTIQTIEGIQTTN
jgi:hypothetical protein